MNTETPKICALILAGGLSSRMGFQDKGLLQIGKLSFVELIAQQLEKQVAHIYVSSNKNQDHYQSLGFSCIDDSPFPSEGPLCAIAAGLEKIDCDYLLIVPCDSPAIPENITERLLLEIIKHQADIACFKQKGKIQPLFSLISTRLQNNLKTNIEQGLRKAQHWIQAENHIAIEDNSAKSYLNINTEEEYEHFKKNYCQKFF